MNADERDPYGTDPHAPGAKLDAGKSRLGLVLSGFARALHAVAEVGTFGAKKYSDNGWQVVPDGKARYLDAALRHLLPIDGKERAADSGLLHLAHAAWNALAVLELHLRSAAPAPEVLDAPAPESPFAVIAAFNAMAKPCPYRANAYGAHAVCEEPRIRFSQLSARCRPADCPLLADAEDHSP